MNENGWKIATVILAVALLLVLCMCCLMAFLGFGLFTTASVSRSFVPGPPPYMEEPHHWEWEREAPVVPQPPPIPEVPEPVPPPTLGETRPWLGVFFQQTGAGAEVTEVIADSPADDAGVLRGDVITHVEGQRVTMERNLADLIARHEPGERVELEVLRDGEEREIRVTLGERTDVAPVPRLEQQLPHHRQ
jgi:hypothetical protein